MKINFEKFPCFIDIKKEQKKEENVKWDFSNAMYIKGGGVAMGALAIKIYNSEGEQEYSDQECELMMQFIHNTSFAPAFIESFDSFIKENK